MAFIKLKTEQIVAGACVLVLAGILTAGLWPFHAPKNNAAWLSNGLLLDRYGTALSADSFTPSKSPNYQGRTVEIWLRPTHLWYESTILAFYSPGEPKRFSLYQSDGGLVIQTDLRSVAHQYDPAKAADLPRVFQKHSQPFITITSGPQGTTTYVDGALVNRFPGFRPGSQTFSGRLVLGTSPVENDSWSGLWRGLAIYNGELTPAQVHRHYESWTTQGRPEIHNDDHSAAVYLFDEMSGTVVHNQVGSGIDLRIPAKYTILAEKFLEPAWEEFNLGWGYWKNVLINIAGFIPLGFFFYAFLSSARHLRRAGLLTAILGLATSLTIEVLQAFLPTRDSGTTDLITNTLGTCFGIVLYRWKPTLIVQTLERLPFLARQA